MSRLALNQCVTRRPASNRVGTAALRPIHDCVGMETKQEQGQGSSFGNYSVSTELAFNCHEMGEGTRRDGQTSGNLRQCSA
jgi:hypothetical protein